MLLQFSLQDKELDVGARFHAARHLKGFKAANNRQLWQIREATADDQHVPSQIVLSSSMIQALNELNTAQAAADDAVAHVHHTRSILFADWYKYMVCAYPGEDDGDIYPEVDYVKWFIENNSLLQVQQAVQDAEQKQAAIAPMSDALSQQIDDFNNSAVSAATLLIQFDSDTADTSAATLVNADSWEDNTPFSTHCKPFNGTDAYLTISGQSAVKALSLWVYLAAQENENGTLLATQDLGALITKGSISDFYAKIAIDGVTQPSYQSLQWYHLPQGRWCHLYIEFNDTLGDTDVIYLFGYTDAQCVSGKLAGVRLFNAALSDDDITNDHNMLGHQIYLLAQADAPRFWQPTEPVVLLEGAAVEPTNRHGEDGRLNPDNTLSCDSTTATGAPLTTADLGALLTTIDGLRPADGTEKIGFNTWSKQPWHPLLLEWQVELFPMKDGGNLTVDSRNFDSGFINTNFTLAQNTPDLTVKLNATTISAATIYSGRSILTPFAKKDLTKSIIGYLNNIRQTDCYHVVGTITDAQKTTYQSELSTWYAQKPIVTDDITAYLTWYLTKPVANEGAIADFAEVFASDTVRLADFNYSVIKGYERIYSRYAISQALSGFNDALLMQQQTLQLPVAEPLGFDDYRLFTQQVREALDEHTNMAPIALSDFLPIRSGIMRLHQLHVIDNFGQIKRNLTIEQVMKAGTVDNDMTRGSDDVWLPPRFVQPARINFRWLSADNSTQELNSHPSDTPICGWLLANRLDNSITVYDRDGFAIGIIDQLAEWRSVPGSDVRIEPDNVANAALRNVIKRLAITTDSDDTADKQVFLQNFITVTDKALENIDPESFVNHQELALLMGRPMAVVRASVDLQLQSLPAVHYGWEEFHQDILGDGSRQTHNFETVKVPIRIGERGQLNDGVVGYWKESGDLLDDVFCTTVAASVTTHDNIKSYDDVSLYINQSISDTADTLTMIIDPRCDIHATVGMLPAKRIDIPNTQYVDALRNINITFLTAPILTAADGVSLPLPNAIGYDWSWLAKDRFYWREVTRDGRIHKDDVLAAFSDGEHIWTALIEKGWLAELTDNFADIIPTDQRSSATLDAPLNKETDKIEQLLASKHIMPVNNKATFVTNTTIREGWLRLRQTQN